MFYVYTYVTSKIELCNNKKHCDKDNSFYYCDNSKFLDTTVYYAKNKTLICRTITKQDKHIILLSQSDNYCNQNFVERYYNTYY